MTFTTFCIPMYLIDNVSQIATGLKVRYVFDGADLGDWKQDFSPCYSNVSEGVHTFSVQGTDGSGNVTSVFSKSFTIQSLVTSPSPSPSGT